MRRGTHQCHDACTPGNDSGRTRVSRACALQPRLCCTVKPRSIPTSAVTGCRHTRGVAAWRSWVNRGEPPVLDASAPKRASSGTAPPSVWSRSGTPRSSSGTAPPSVWSRSGSAPRALAHTGVGVLAVAVGPSSGTAPPSVWSMSGRVPSRHANTERVVYRLSSAAQGRGGGGRRRAPRRGAAAGGVVGVATLWASEPMPRTTLTSNVVPRRRLSSPPLCRTGSRPAVHPGEWRTASGAATRGERERGGEGGGSGGGAGGSSTP